MAAPVAGEARQFPKEPSWSLHSPHKVLTATITVAGRQARVTVRRKGVIVLRADLGRLPTTSRRSHSRRPRSRISRVADSFTTPTGKRRIHRLAASRLTLWLAGRARLEVLAADDGIALRQTGFKHAAVTYRPPTGHRVWLQRLISHYEGDYPPSALADASGAYGYPALLASRHGIYTLLTEAGLHYRQSAEHLTANARRPGTLTTAGADRRPERRRTGWRVAVIGELADIVESDLPITLGRPSKIADTSWIRSGRVAWSWWSDSFSPQRLHTQRDYVDFAARAGFEYVLVDAGWDPAWMPSLIAYAAAKGVRVLLWTNWRDLRDPAKRAATLDQWAAWGAAGIKVDYLQGDHGARMAVMEDISEAAADRRLMVNFHGCTVPRGLQRTWPNVMSMEGTLGAEHAKGGRPQNPALNVTLSFTRNVIGSMDYTPVTFSARNRVTTAGAELAQAVVYESGLQHYADSPTSYEQRPAAMEVLTAVPAAWDDIQLLDGAPGTHVTLARRSGEHWFVGSISATAARTQPVQLNFLTAGRRYRARLYADDGADGIAVSERVVTAADVWQVPVTANAGFTITLSLLP